MRGPDEGLFQEEAVVGVISCWWSVVSCQLFVVSGQRAAGSGQWAAGSGQRVSRLTTDNWQLRTGNYCAATKYLRLKLRSGTQAANVPMAITEQKIITRSVAITFTG